MPSKGTNLTKQIEVYVGEQTNGRVKIWRTNAGNFWGGEFDSRHTIKGVTYTVLKNASRVEGLPKGFSDLLAVIPTIVTPDMVGKTVGVAGFVEAKAEGDTVKEHQEQFLAIMRACGCRAGIARSPEDAINIVTGGVSDG